MFNGIFRISSIGVSATCEKQRGSNRRFSEKVREEILACSYAKPTVDRP